ncbi:MAG: response regulator [Bacteroidetes bacterium]|nr:response regulator [Bacteroidota bacterium]
MENLDYNKATTWEKIKYSFRSWRYIGVGKSLLLWFLTISIVPLASISFINFLNAYHGLTIVAEKSLNTTSQLRVAYINTFFNEIVDFLELNSRQNVDINFIVELDSTWQKSNLDLKEFTKTTQWDQITAEHRDEFKDLAKKNGYHDVYFMDFKGNILFSLREETDLGTNLFTGPYRFTHFADAARKAIETNSLRFSDLEFYEPSFNALTGHFVQPVSNNSGELIGLIALQVTMDRINNIIQQDAGYGETGQAYIVGNDRLLRSSMRFGIEAEIMETKINNQKVTDWLFYLQNRHNPQVLKENELDIEKVSTYDSDQSGRYVLGIYRNLSALEPMGVNWTLIEEIDHSEAFAYARKLSDIVKLSFIITIVLVFFTSILVTRWFVNPIKQLSSWAKEVAVGEVTSKQIKAPKNEIGEMVDTFNRLIHALQTYADVAKMMAKGDYTEKVEIRSENDLLGTSMNQMVESFRQVVDQANRIAQGDYSVTVVPRSDKDTLNVALYKMTRTLEENAKQNKEQNWLKSGINELDSGLSGQPDTLILAQSIIDFTSRYLQTQLGLIYIYEEQAEEFILKASFAADKRNNKIKQSFKTGEGLIGQVAKDQKMILLNENTEQQAIEIGEGTLQPKQYILFPLVHEGKTLGVLEYATISPFDELKITFLELSGVNMAIAIKTVMAAETVKKLLEQTQNQANELAVQQEELRQANEELQEQTNALKISEESLQTQQEELKVTNEELEERTKALKLQRDAIKHKNTELETARKEIEQKARDLEQASQYKSEFLANMSHELRTPLNSILVLSQLLAENKKEHLDGKELEYARTINGSGSDLLELINEILDLSKVESGKIELFIENLYLDDLALFIKKSFGPVADKKGLELFVNIANDLPKHIRTDVQRFHQIIKNLYSNAIKFTHEGSISLNIFHPAKDFNFKHDHLSSQNSVAFSVTDTGIGIPTDKLQLIFEAFKQADGTTSRKYGGTGLGLSISKGFSEILGGEIKVESKVGEGTTFTVILPIEYTAKETVDTDEMQSEEAEKPQQIDNSESTPSIEPTDSGQTNKDEAKQLKSLEGTNDDRNSIMEGDMVLLIIDDDKNFTRLLYELAHEHRFKCLIAHDGESGLHYADYYLPHAIILDIGLPGIDGYEVMTRLKQNSRTRHIPVHYVSAADKSIEHLKQGAIGYLSKPVSKETLDEAFSKIEKIISNPLKRLIIVEDEESMRISIANLMKSENIEILTVDSGEEALEKISKQRFDCMILDLGLKNMSGFELLEAIKANPETQHLPVVVYTAQDLSREEDLMLQQYANSIVLKGARSFERLLSETTLFLHQVQAGLSQKKQEMLRKIQPREDVLSGKTVLIVDDDMRNVFALTSVLENYEINVIFAKNGREGIEKLKANKAVNLVLMDIMMPEMDGYEAMKQIRKEKKYQKLPIIALTAKAMKDDREKCLAAGANEYLSKPVDATKLISILRVWLYN